MKKEIDMLLAKLRAERLEAAKTNKIKRSILTTLLGEAETVSKKSGNEIDDFLLTKLAKGLIDSNKEVLAYKHSEKLVEENVILAEYIPEQMSEEKLRSIIQSSEKSDMKGIMQFLSANYKGEYDGRMANKIAREFI
jgi:uncharacterized protein YqeY